MTALFVMVVLAVACCAWGLTRRRPTSEAHPPRRDGTHSEESVQDDSHLHNEPQRWKIEYTDDFGNPTERVIRIRHVDLRRMGITAYCEMRGSERTFKIRRIVRAVDPDSGQPIPIDEYIERIRSARRQQRKGNRT